ncbi:CapA family protein [Pseudomonadota bacterium]
MTFQQLNDHHVSHQINIQEGQENDLLLLGDTSHGENYLLGRQQSGLENILTSQGYQYSFDNFSDLLRQADLVMANLETPITNIVESPFHLIKEYVHWTDINAAPTCLQNNNIQMVSLANNHVIDFGEQGLQQTFDILERHNIQYFGAGKNSERARQPCVIQLKHQHQSKTIILLSAFHYRPSYHKKYHAYASDQHAGVHPLSEETIQPWIQEVRTTYPDAFIILFPHWGANYKWVRPSQLRLANGAVNAGVDLIIGHGAHMFQNISKVCDKWVAFSIGNFVFNSPGRYSSLSDMPSVSLIARLLLDSKCGEFTLTPRFYPIQSDNLITHFQPRFLTDTEFSEFHPLLTRPYKTEESPVNKINIGRDMWGNYIQTPEHTL